MIVRDLSGRFATGAPLRVSVIVTGIAARPFAALWFVTEIVVLTGSTIESALGEATGKRTERASVTVGPEATAGRATAASPAASAMSPAARVDVNRRCVRMTNPFGDDD